MKKTKRLLSLLLAVIVVLALVPTAAFATGASTAGGSALLTGFRIGGQAGNAGIINDSDSAKALKIIANSKNSDGAKKTGDTRVGETAILGAFHPDGTTDSDIFNAYCYSDNDETAIIVEATGRRMKKTDTFQPGMTYRFTFHENGHKEWDKYPYSDYLGDLTAANLQLRAYPGSTGQVQVTKVETKERKRSNGSYGGFFYDVWMKMAGESVPHGVTLDSNITVTGLTNGKAVEGTELTLTVPKLLSGGKVFAGWEFSSADGSGYSTASDIRRYCSLMNFKSDEADTDKVTCSFLMGDKNISVKALYSADAIIPFNKVTLNVAPAVSDGYAVGSAKAVYDPGYENAYTVTGAYWLRQELDQENPYSYRLVSDGEGFDTSAYRYWLRVHLKVNDRFDFSEDGATFTINGKSYTGFAIDDVRDDRRPVSYEHSHSFNYFGEEYNELDVFLPLDQPEHRVNYTTTIPPVHFCDAPELESVTVSDAGGHTYASTIENGSAVWELAQGISYHLDIQVKVPAALHTALQNGSVTLMPNYQYLMKDKIGGENVWQSSSTDNKPKQTADGKSYIYTYSTEIPPVTAGDKYFLIFGTNLLTTVGDKSEKISETITSGIINCVASKVIVGGVYYTNYCAVDKPLTTDAIVYAPDGTTRLTSGLNYRWQRYNSATGAYEDIADATTDRYTPTAADVGREIRLVVTVDGYDGALYGEDKLVNKGIRSDYPTMPQLSLDSSDYKKVTVANAKADQEYIVSYSASVPSYGTWTPGGSSGSLTLSAAANTTVYVYTRFREDEAHEAGKVCVYNYTFTGTTTAIRNITLDRKTIDLAHDASAALTVKPIPENATGWDEKTIRWYINDPDKSGIKLYSDAACSKELSKDSDGFYRATAAKTIYVKGGSQVSNAEIGAQLTLGATDIRVAICKLNVADAAGNYKLNQLVQLLPNSLTAAPGETVSVNYIPDPIGATLVGTSWTLKQGETAVAMGSGEFTIGENTITIKIPQDRAAGHYAYTADFVLGSYRPVIYVDVQTASIPLTGIRFSQKTLTLNQGESAELAWVKEPVNTTDKSGVTVRSDNTAVAIPSDGKIKAVAPGSAVITVSCGGFTDTCTVTVIDASHACTASVWMKLSETKHCANCTICGRELIEDHSFSADGYCKCGARKTVSYAITVTNGVASLASGSIVDRAAAGEVVTVTADPAADGKKFVRWEVTSGGVTLADAGSAITNFTMPSSAVALKAVYADDGGAEPIHFTDVPSGSYYEDAVTWAVKNDITNGMTDTTFEPNATCTRAQAVTFLWRSSGRPTPKSSAMPFTDVKVGSYYYDAVLWAVENGITKGTSETTFSPNENCSRGQIVTFLWRARKSPAAGTDNPFKDVKPGAYYAEAVLWAVKADVTKGTSDTTFSPNDDCTRAQIVTFIFRALAG